MAQTARSDSREGAVLQAILRQDFASFLQKVFATVCPGTVFLDNWHIHALAWHLERVRRGEIKRLAISLPPRGLKSIAASVALPAFALGHDPARRIICASYAADLARKHANDFRLVLSQPWYRQLFPWTRISPSKDTEYEVATTRQGFRLATSVGGTLTGRGGDLLIVDDPLKVQDAHSEARREAANEWFLQTALSRLDNRRQGAIIVVMHRVHTHDLVGRLAEDPDGWTFLSLPAIATTAQAVPIGSGRLHHRSVGDVLHPEREPLEELDRLKREMGSEQFAAQYQQEPVPPGGAMIKKEWLRRYASPPAKRAGGMIVQSWDTAAKVGPENDYSVCTTWLVQDGSYYLLQLERDRFDYPTLRAKALALVERDRPDAVLVEDAGTGTALGADLSARGVSVIPIKVLQDKVTRMFIQAARFEAGQVVIPERAPWLADLEMELFTFPQSRHDDQVDSISQLLAWEGRRYRLLEVL
jgi:predicted phage terminase large subunit-like protein